VAGSNGVVRWSDVARMPSRYGLLAAATSQRANGEDSV
jgi:hypothetical protein